MRKKMQNKWLHIQIVKSLSGLVNSNENQSKFEPKEIYWGQKSKIKYILKMTNRRPSQKGLVNRNGIKNTAQNTF